MSIDLSRRAFLGLATLTGILTACGLKKLIKPGDSNEREKLKDNTMKKSYDVIVIGGSFAGISAAMQVARARRSVLIISHAIARNRYATTTHGMFGHDGANIQDLNQKAKQQLISYPTVEWLQAEAVDAIAEVKKLRIFLTDGRAVEADRLIIATGVKDELPKIAGVKERWGQSVIQCPYCHGYEVAEKRFAVIATGEASLHQAMILPDWSTNITFFTNNGVDVSHKAISDLKAKGVKIVTQPIVELVGKNTSLEAIKLADGSSLAADIAFLVNRVSQSSNIPARLGCAMEDGPFGPFIKTDNLKATSIERVYAAGDAARPFHNATWAAADGVMAGIFTHQSLLRPENPYRDKHQ